MIEIRKGGDGILLCEMGFVCVGYISIIYFCDKAKGTIHRSKNKQ